MRTGEQIIADVAETVTERRKGYGHPAENFRSIAIGWQEILKCEVTARQVALCMMWLKSCRLISQPDHEDSILDVHGYAMCYADCWEPENPHIGSTLESAYTKDEWAGISETAKACVEEYVASKADTADTDAPVPPDAPLPDYMTYRECRTCHWPVDCRTKGACREASRDPA